MTLFALLAVVSGWCALLAVAGYLAVQIDGPRSQWVATKVFGLEKR